ncbi:MAG: M4 family metallopeptidase [Ferruginibacter sp.]
MKKLITLMLACTMFFVFVQAQEIQKGNPGMWPAFIKYGATAPAFSKSNVAILDAAGKSASITNGLVKNVATDARGMQHYRYQQTLNDIAIENAIMLVHVQNGKIMSENGKWIKNFPAVLQARPVLIENSALNKALQYVGAQTYKWQLPEEEAFIKREQNNAAASFYPTATLVYYSGERDVIPSALRLAYKFDIYAQQPLSRQLVFVDAATGEVLGKRELIHETNAIGTAQTAYSGTQTITTDFTGTNYRLRETGRGAGVSVNTYNLQGGVSYATAIDFTDADNNWNNVNTARDEYATDAHWGAEKTYDYYFQKFNRNSIDNAGMALNSYVHYSTSYFNAFWDGSRMTYGDGDATNGNRPLTSLDVCGHEITHGVTERTSALVYSYESGAMNEAFSDIFGTAIEAFARPTNTDWLIGGDFFTIRNMSNPNQFNHPDTYGGTFWYTGAGDNGGVHYNSGVLNFWFYLLTVGGSGVNDHNFAYNVSGIGMDKAAAIAYRLNTVYLTPTSEYYDARLLGIQAAEDLYGIGSNEAVQTANAFAAVGLYAATCAQITGLNTTSVLDRSATVRWTADPGAVTYSVQYKLTTSTTWSPLTTVTADSLNILGLVASTTYDWRVRSSCNASYSYSQFTTAAPICMPPPTVTVVSSSSSVVLNWSAAYYAVSYDVEYKLPADNIWIPAGNTTGTSITISGLTAPTTYDCRIRNNCSFGTSGYNQFQFTTTLTPCDAPTGLAFSYSGNTSSFTWNAVPGAISYSLHLAFAGGSFGSQPYTTVTNNFVDVVNLMQGGNFQAMVVTNCANGSSLPGSTLLFSTPCSAPSSLSATNISYTSATLNWVPAATNNNNTAFSVAYRLAGTSNAWTSIGSTTASSVIVNGLTAGTSYEWRVRKLCSAFNSVDVLSQFTTVAAPPCNAPTGLASTGVTASQASLSWTAVSGAVTYSVQYRPAGTSSWITAANTAATNYGISGLAASTLYDWRVGTVCSLNSSSYSTAQFTTSTANGCNVPTGLNATNIGNTGATLTWNAMSGVNSYKLQYRVAASNSWIAISNINTNSYTLSNLAMATTYEFQVSSKCGSTLTAYSPLKPFTTLNCATSANNTAQWIDLFKVGSINRVSGADPGGYINTGLSTNLVIGSVNAGQISAGFAGAAASNNYTVYIDFNRNGSFNETDEKVAGASLINTAGTFNFNITIPATATPGITGMRVVMRKNTDGSPGPCLQGFVGEAEDYTVNLTTTAFQGFGNNDPYTFGEVRTASENVQAKPAITVAPNPSSGIYKLSFNSGFNPVYYDIINTNGLAVKSAKVVSAKTLQLDITAMPAGLYLLRLTDIDGKKQTLRLIKE